MRKGQISIYYGEGKGKTCVAVGRGLRAVGDEMRVVMIQFLDYHNTKELSVLKKLEPDFRTFRFEKHREAENIDEAAMKEISSEIRNAFNFSNKIVDTGECEMLMLDGVLECVEKEYLTEEELIELIEKRPDYMDILLTGTMLPKKLSEKADSIYCITTEKSASEF